MRDDPLITHLFTADPSAHVFEGRIFLYPSHDRDTGIADNDNGDQYDMVDYHVFSMPSADGPVTDHGIALALEDIPWASRQLWAPDAACKDGSYYLYFPARDSDGVFRIGVAVADKPQGPFRADPNYMTGSYSIDPCALVDDDGEAYLYFGGIWGGQLQCWRNGSYDPNGAGPQPAEPALGPRVAKLSRDMRSFDGPAVEIAILSPEGEPLLAGDEDRRYFEGPWVHKANGRYYLSYSTGTTHRIVYATADNPYGPFTYAGRILEPVVGWTTHHSIVEHEGRTFLFYHDASLSGGRNHLRCVKVVELFYDDAGHILPASVPSALV